MGVYRIVASPVVLRLLAVKEGDVGLAGVSAYQLVQLVECGLKVHLFKIGNSPDVLGHFLSGEVVSVGTARKEARPAAADVVG